MARIPGAQNTIPKEQAMNKQVVEQFAGAINEHNVEKICSLMTDDHTFIDSQGHETVGKEVMKSGWAGYFQLFPDYAIEVTEFFVSGDTVAAFGFAGGTFKGEREHKENSWRLPAAWKAVIKNGKLQLWQVFADSKIPYDIVNGLKKP